MYFYLSAITFPKLGQLVFNNVSRLNHSLPMNNTIKKIKHAPHLLTLGPQIAFKRKCHQFISCNLFLSSITTKVNIYIYKYEDDYICKGLLQVICFVTINN